MRVVRRQYGLWGKRKMREWRGESYVQDCFQTVDLWRYAEG